MTNQIQLPGYQDYLSALRNPQHFLMDSGLKAGEVVLSQRNSRPITYSGNFALTVPFIADEHQYAIRCFLHLIPGIAERYAAITKFVKQANSEVLVDIEYQQEGILVNGSRYAICKMEWVDGLTLDKYIESNLDHPAFLSFLPNQFIDLVQQLRVLGCAHGDLQHGNIIANGTRLCLVDYDGMYVPEFEGRGLKATEIGHQNYQHPHRNADMFHSELDHFSSIAIFLSLKVIEHDPKAYDFSEDGAIYLKKGDYEAPDDSKRIQKIADIGYPEAAERFREICKGGIDDIPDLITFIQEDQKLFDDLPGRMRRDISEGAAVVRRKKATSKPQPPTPRAKKSSNGVAVSTGAAPARSAPPTPSRDAPSLQKPASQKPASQPASSNSRPAARSSSVPASGGAQAFGSITPMFTPSPSASSTSAPAPAPPPSTAATPSQSSARISTSPAPSAQASSTGPLPTISPPPAPPQPLTRTRPLTENARKRGVLFRTIALALYLMVGWGLVLASLYEQSSSSYFSSDDNEAGSLFVLEIILPALAVAWLANLAVEPVLSNPRAYFIWRFLRATIISALSVGVGAIMWITLYHLGGSIAEYPGPSGIIGAAMLLGIPFTGTIVFSANFGKTRLGKVFKTAVYTFFIMFVLTTLLSTLVGGDWDWGASGGMAAISAFLTLTVTIPVWFADRLAKGRSIA